MALYVLTALAVLVLLVAGVAAEAGSISVRNVNPLSQAFSYEGRDEMRYYSITLDRGYSRLFDVDKDGTNELVVVYEASPQVPAVRIYEIGSVSLKQVCEMRLEALEAYNTRRATAFVIRQFDQDPSPELTVYYVKQRLMAFELDIAHSSAKLEYTWDFEEDWWMTDVKISDVDGDGTPEVMVIVNTGTPGDWEAGTELYIFKVSGHGLTLVDHTTVHGTLNSIWIQGVLDVDGDGEAEVVLCGDIGESADPYFRGGALIVYSLKEGTLHEEARYYFEYGEHGFSWRTPGPTVFVDVNDDGHREIIVWDRGYRPDEDDDALIIFRKAEDRLEMLGMWKLKADIGVPGDIGWLFTFGGQIYYMLPNGTCYRLMVTLEEAYVAETFQVPRAAEDMPVKRAQVLSADDYGFCGRYVPTDVDAYPCEIFLYTSILIDEEPPHISEPSISPSEPYEGEPVTVSVSVEDSITGVENVTLYYRTSTTISWTPLAMTYEAGVWKATIPGQPANTTVEFYIEAYDKAGNRAQTLIYTYTVKAKPTPPEERPPSGQAMVWVAVAVGLGASIGGAAIAAFLLGRKKP